MSRYKWIFILVLAVSSCNKDRESDFPLIHTGIVTDIDSTGALFSARIADLGKDEIISFGFVWGTKKNPVLGNADTYFFPDKPATGIHSVRISSTLQKQTTYFVRSFVRSDKFTSYGQEVSFVGMGSLGPQIIEFFPIEGNLGDTILILGRNFSHVLTNNVADIGGFPASVISANQDSLMVIVPVTLNIELAPVSVSIFGNKVSSPENFQLIKPVLTDFTEKEATFGSQINITGNRFLENPSSIIVKFDQYIAQITELQDQSIVVIVPDSLDKRKCHITVTMNNLSVTSQYEFQLADLILDDFQPRLALTGNTVTLSGFNFSPIAKNNVVTVGGIKMNLSSVTTNELTFSLPLQQNIIYPSREVSIKVEVFGDSKEFNEKLTINDNWFRLKDAPTGYSFDFVKAFSRGNKAYIGLNNSSTFWEYDPLFDEWTLLADFPGSPRHEGVGFILGNNLYFGTGGSGYPDYEIFKDWWKYDILTDEWTQLNDFAGSERVSAVAFQVGNVGYLGTGFEDYELFSDFWSYNSATDSWERISDYPKKMRMGIAISNSTNALVGLGHEDSFVAKFDPTTNSWQNIQNFPFTADFYDKIGFTLLNSFYLKTHWDQNFYKYNESANSWSPISTDILTYLYSSVGFSIDNKAFVGLGITNAMWEYDPQR